MFTRFFAVIILLTISSMPLYAQEVPSPNEQAAVEETPITVWIEAENELLDSMPRQNREVFFVFRNKHSVMRSIHVVLDEIDVAVNSCAENNPEMASRIETRFEEMQNAVRPILKEGRQFLDKELADQEAFYERDFRLVMELNDAAYAFSQSMITKEPVATMRACNGLMRSMDRTEDKLVDLLQAILLPEDVVRMRLKNEAS